MSPLNETSLKCYETFSSYSGFQRNWCIIYEKKTFLLNKNTKIVCQIKKNYHTKERYKQARQKSNIVPGWFEDTSMS